MLGESPVHIRCCHFSTSGAWVLRATSGSENSNSGLIWPSLVLFTPSRKLEMRPPWPRLALRSLVSGVPGVDSFGPPVAPLLDVRGAGDRDGMRSSLLRGHDGGVARSGKLLILFRFVPFRSIPCRLRGQGCEVPAFAVSDGGARRSGKLLIWLHFVAFPSPEPSPSALSTPRGRGDLQGCEVPSFAGTTSAIRQNDACEQCSNRRGYGAMGCCRYSEGGAWSDGCRLGSAVSHVSEFVHRVVNGAG